MSITVIIVGIGGDGAQTACVHSSVEVAVAVALGRVHATGPSKGGAYLLTAIQLGIDGSEELRDAGHNGQVDGAILAFMDGHTLASLGSVYEVAEGSGGYGASEEVLGDEQLVLETESSTNGQILTSGIIAIGWHAFYFPKQIA